MSEVPHLLWLMQGKEKIELFGIWLYVGISDLDIEKIIIENFKGLKKVVLGPVKPINILIGHNNCGKSSILECLDFFCKHLENENKIYEMRHNPTGERPSNSLPENVFNLEKEPISITIQILLNLDDRKNVFYKSIEIWNEKYRSPKTSMDVADNLIDEGFLCNLSCQFEAKSHRSGFTLSEVYTTFSSKSKEFENQKIVLVKGNIRNSQINDIRGFLIKERNTIISERINTILEYRPEKESTEIFKGIWVDGIYNYIRNMFKTTFVINPYRHGQSQASPQLTEELAADGNNLVQYLHNLALNDHQLFEKIAGFVKTVLPEVGRLHPRFTGSETSSLELAYEWKDGRIVNLANMGGGVEQVLILGAMLISQRKACILLEEPESHLHPGAQEALLGLIEKYIGDSLIFLATHSPVFIQPRDTISIHAIYNSEGKNAIGSTIEFEDFNEILTLIGSRPGHLAQADIVLYVEGKNGAVVVEEWLKKWPKKINVLSSLQLVVLPINVDEIGAKDFDILEFKKITPNMIIFADKDNDPGEQKPKKSRLDLKDKCEKNNIPFILTDKRQIEDYFTEDAVRKSLPANIVKSWEYDKNKPMSEQYLCKKYNKTVASKMSWEDVEKHEDIMSIFDEIKNIGNRLKPNI